jgi:hypothetical protein
MQNLLPVLHQCYEFRAAACEVNLDNLVKRRYVHMHKET